MGRNLTGEDDQEKMIEKFLDKMNGPTQFCNENSFPSNESDDDAYDRCDSDEGRFILNTSVIN